MHCSGPLQPVYGLACSQSGPTGRSGASPCLLHASTLHARSEVQCCPHSVLLWSLYTLAYGHQSVIQAASIRPRSASSQLWLGVRVPTAWKLRLECNICTPARKKLGSFFLARSAIVACLGGGLGGGGLGGGGLGGGGLGGGGMGDGLRWMHGQVIRVSLMIHMQS